MSGMYIRGIGAVGNFGCGLDALLLAAEKGRPLIRKTRADTTELERFVPATKLRRAQHFVRMALLAAHLAMEDADLPCTDEAGLVVATGIGPAHATFDFLDSIINDGAPLASPTAFSLSVHNVAASSLSILLGFGGPCLTISQFSMSLASALVTAQVWLSEGRADAVLLGAVDEQSEFLSGCGELADGPNADWKLSSDLPTGEGAVFLLLAPEPGLRRRCRIGDVCLCKSSHALPKADAIIAGQGAMAAAAEGRLQLPANSPILGYAPAYGHTPMAMAFDTALAAICLDRASPLPGSGVPVRRVACVETAPSGLTAIVPLAREELYG